MTIIEKAANIAIKTRGLCKEFAGLVAVDCIDLEVKRGEVFAFLGPNGAGKSTTIRMLTTLLKPTRGEIRVNGFNPLTEEAAVRQSFGIVFQDPSLDEDLTAYENMEFHGALYEVPNQLREKRIEELLRLVELWQRKDSFVRDFSGGMKRRLEIARGLLHHPKILFLDEPTIGLDPQTRNQIWKYIQSLNEKEKITVFFTTHYIEEAEKVSQRIAIIDNGKIVAAGTSQELMAKTDTLSLEAAFLLITGHSLREESANSKIERLRQGKKLNQK
ncbi:MAG: ATP-binding cassette domain-containing protein [bacterium]